MSLLNEGKWMLSRISLMKMKSAGSSSENEKERQIQKYKGRKSG